MSLFHGITHTVRTVPQAFHFSCWVGRPRPVFYLLSNSSPKGMKMKPLALMPQSFSGELWGLGWRSRWESDC